MSRNRWQAAFVVAFIGQCLALYWPRTPTVSPGLPSDKIVHVLLFAVVAAIGVRAGLPRAWVIGLLLSQAVLSELIQEWFLSGRGGDVRDLAADALGIAIGILAGRAWIGRVGQGDR